MTRKDQSIKRALIAGTALAGAILLTAPVVAKEHAAFTKALRAELGIGGSQTSTLRNPGKMKGARAGALDGESQILNGFYSRQDFRAIWFTSRGGTAKAKLFLDRLGRAGEHGLEPEDYGYASLAAGAKTFSSGNRAALEVSMSRAFARYAADVNAGRIHPTRRVPGLYIRPVRPDPERLLVAAATTKNFANYVDSLSPRTPQYARLLKAMAYYRAIAARGGWQPVAPGPTLKPGMSDPRVAQIKARLRIVGDLKAKGATPNFYTPALVVAVKRFQYRHGLEQDGNVGKTTLKAMNV
ncbi:MAG: peptidoglycan-binding protein, partial [Alphaproteobacteria bacterium]|nr:peptidoglycan-binding protein [Alphaproteobacteria bacterium]